MYFSNAKEIHVVCPDGYWMWGGNSEHFPWPCADENLLFIENDGMVNEQLLTGPEMEILCKRWRKEARLASGGEAWSTDEEYEG